MKIVLCGVVALASLAVCAEEGRPHVIFLEPVGHIDASGAEISAVRPLYRMSTNEQKYVAWMKNESAARALRLCDQALKVIKAPADAMNYYIALVAGGNHAAVGFRLQTSQGTNEFPHRPYILLDAEPSRFETTLLHETGHMIMTLLAGGHQLEGEQMASIPHTTAALSDRATAFSEGWAIHLETLAAHLARSPDLRHRYHREAIEFGDIPWKAVEYFRHSVDLTSYSQNLARYSEVRDNNFAFDSAFQGPDYLRVQLEKPRDFSMIRDANQLLQSEGFYASFFFLFVIRGRAMPSEEVVTLRHDRLLRAMASMFAAVKAEPSTPWLPNFVTEYMKMFPDEKGSIVDVLNDLSHGAFVDPVARQRWREHYLAALRIDRGHLNVEALNAARKRWREQVLADPRILFSRLGPQLACTVPACTINIEVFEQASPLRFDLNTAPPAILRLIPGITEDEITRWTAERDRKPFDSLQDFRTRVRLSSAGSKMEFESKK